MKDAELVRDCVEVSIQLPSQTASVAMAAATSVNLISS